MQLKKLLKGDNVMMSSNKKTIPQWIVTIIVVSICMFCLIISTCFFIYNQLKFTNEYSEVARMIRTQFTGQLSSTYAEIETEQLINKIEGLQIKMIQDTIKHLEQLHLLQKNSTSNELMSFVYTILSTILISLCMIFIERSYNSVKESSNIANNVRTRLEEIEEDVTKIKGDATKAREANEIEKANHGFLSVLVKILLAIGELHLGVSAITNERIKTVCDAVKKISNNMSHDSIIQIQTELGRLKKEINECHKKVEKLPEGGNKPSQLESIGLYNKMLDTAIDRCNELLKNRSKS